MAKLPQGINGPFIGRIGNMVGYMLGDVNVIRNIGKTDGERTPDQRANEQRLGLISSLSKIIEPFINFGFRSVAGPRKQAPANHSVSINKEYAVKGTYPHQETDFAKLIVAQGNVAPPKNAQIEVADNQLKFSWEADLEADGADKTDQIMLLAYLPKAKKAVILASGARRTSGQEILELPEFDTATTIETFIAFVSDDRMDASNSVYTGQVIIQPTIATAEEQPQPKVRVIEGTAIITGENEAGEITVGIPARPDPGFSEMNYSGNGHSFQTEKMRMISPMLSQFKKQIALGFQHGKKSTSAINKAISYNINNAIVGDEIYQIYFPAVVFSAGKRETAWATKFTLIEQRTVKINWDVPKTAKMKQIGDDTAYVLFYNSTAQRQTESGAIALRKDFTATLELSHTKPGDRIYAWMFFASPDGKSVSNTDYLGFVEISK